MSCSPHVFRPRVTANQGTYRCIGCGAVESFTSLYYRCVEPFREPDTYTCRTYTGFETEALAASPGEP